MSFTGKTAVVTGGSRGLGRAICRRLAEGGANVVFSYAGNTAAAQEITGRVEHCTARRLPCREMWRTRTPLRP